MREVPAREVPARQVEADTTEMPPVSLADVLATERAQALLVPVPDPAGVGPAVAPVLPGRPQENGPRVRGWSRIRSWTGSPARGAPP